MVIFIECANVKHRNDNAGILNGFVDVAFHQNIKAIAVALGWIVGFFCSQSQ
jgi:hypothetical protein